MPGASVRPSRPNERAWVLVTLALAFFAPALWAGEPAAVTVVPSAVAPSTADLAVVEPSAVGLDAERLARIDQRFVAYTEAGEWVGGMGLIARRGEVAFLELWGQRDREQGLPVEEDTIFRIYSMSKPVTSVAVMMLFEEGHFGLWDPIARYIPELADLQVLEDVSDPDAGEPTTRLRPAARQPTILDLLRHSAGLTYGYFGNTPVDRMYRERQILAGQADLAELVHELGQLPLLYDPGTRWHYSVATDVLGRLVEVVSGQPFESFLKARIFDPLGMVDTGFTVPAAKRPRFAQLYSPKAAGDGDELWLEGSTRGALEVARQELDQVFRPEATFQSGGGGLVSTAHDYLRFCHMILGGGALDGHRILSRKTLELMAQDHTRGLERPYPVPGVGFGLGFDVVEEPGRLGELSSKGLLSWAGAAGTGFWIDPEEEMVGIFMTQIIPHTGLTYRKQFRHLAYQAIAD